MTRGKPAIAIIVAPPAEQAHAAERAEKNLPAGRSAAKVTGQSRGSLSPGSNEIEYI
jgi:hypothetical protein